MSDLKTFKEKINAVKMSSRPILDLDIESYEQGKADILEEVRKIIEGKKKIVPKNPLDITPREAMETIIQPVYRPYISPEESVNNTLEDILKEITIKE